MSVPLTECKYCGGETPDWIEHEEECEEKREISFGKNL